MSLLGVAVAEGIRAYLHDLDRIKDGVAFLKAAQGNVEEWSEDHLDWFLGANCGALHHDLMLREHRRHAIKRWLREGRPFPAGFKWDEGEKEKFPT